MGQNALAGGVHGVGDLASRIFGRGPAPNAGSSIVHQPSSPEAAALLQQTQLDPSHLMDKGGSALVRGVGNVAGDTAADVVRQAGQVGGDVAQVAQVAAPLVSGVRGLAGDAADATAVARSPEDVRTAAGYTNLGTKADMHAPGSLATTDTLAADDLHIPKGTVPSQQAIIDARNKGPGAGYNRVLNQLPDNMTHDAQLTTDLKNLQDSTSQLPRSPDVDALQKAMLDQPNMTREQLRSNISDARDRASTKSAQDSGLDDAYNSLANSFEDYMGRQLQNNPGAETQATFQGYRKDFAQSYLGQKSFGADGVGDHFSPKTYGDFLTKNPQASTDNGAIIGHVYNNLKSGPVAGAGEGSYHYAPMAMGAAAGGALGAGVSHLTGMPGLGELGGALGIGAGPFMENMFRNFQRRGNPEAAAAASTNPALSYFRRGAPDGPGSLNLTSPPGTVYDQLQHEMNVPQGPGPNPDLKLTPPPGAARPVLDNQTDLVTPQGPGGVNKNLPQSPPGTGGLQPGLFDQIEAQGAPRSTAPTMFDQIDNPPAQGTPASLPKGKQFGGALFRGTPEGVDPQAANEAGVRFLTPNVTPEEGGTAASDYGDVNVHKVAFKNMIDEGGPADNARALGLPETANQMEIAAAAKKAGYDGMRTKVGKGYEYADLNPAPPAAPAPGIGDQIAGT
jgi:hypothetical protein